MPVLNGRRVSLDEFREATRAALVEVPREPELSDTVNTEAEGVEQAPRRRKTREEKNAEAEARIAAKREDTDTEAEDKVGHDEDGNVISSTGDAPDPDPDADGIGDGQGPFSSDERDIQEAEQEHAKMERKAKGLEPHEVASLERKAVREADETAPDGERDHTGIDGKPADIGLDGLPLDEAPVKRGPGRPRKVIADADAE